MSNEPWPSTWYPSYDVLNKLPLVQDRFWRTTPSTNFPLSVRPPFIIFLYPPSSTPSYLPATPTQLNLGLLPTSKSSPSLQNRAQWTFWQCTRLIGIVARSNSQRSRQKVLHICHILIPQPILVNHHTASFRQRSNCSWPISWKLGFIIFANFNGHL